MKLKTWCLIFWLIPALLAPGPVLSQDLIVYTKSGCAFCEQARTFLETSKEEHPGFQYEERNISKDPDALTAFQNLIVEKAIERPVVPLIQVNDQLIIGFRPDETPHLIGELLGWHDEGTSYRHRKPERSIPAWVSLDRLGLPFFTITLGLLDGFNPCAMWVLMFLLSMLVHIKSRKRMFLIAGIFVLISGIIYFLFMAAWLNLFLAFRWSDSLRILIGALGLTAGMFHLKDFFMKFKGASLSISAENKSRIGASIRSVITARNLPVAVLAVSALAILVNFYELLCTAGLPALYTQILVNQSVEGARFYGFLLLYNIAYIFDDGMMVFAATWALSSRRLKAGTGRVLKGLSGLLLLLLSLLLILKPEWLSFTS